MPSSSLPSYPLLMGNSFTPQIAFKMDMSNDTMTATCQISMLWNWTVLDACFLTSGWHITTRGAFAASCIGTALLAVLLEALRRASKEYDQYATRQLRALPAKTKKRATPLQQLIRAVLHTFTFGVAYILMLLAMYYNGYMIISIFLGSGVGKFLCDWLTVGSDVEDQEDYNPTVCCG